LDESLSALDRLLRSQLEQQYIAQEVGDDHLANRNALTELRKVKSEMAALKKRLKGLQDRRTELEEQLR